MARIEIYYHETCYSSFKLISLLEARGTLDRVVLRRAYPSSFNGVIWSVPWITLDGEPAATDPVSLQDIEAIMGGGRIPERRPIDAFKEAVLHSSYATAVSLVNSSIEPVIDRGFLSAALRAPLTGVDVDEAAEVIREASREIFEDIYDSMVKSASVSMVRYMWWSRGGSLPAEPPDDLEYTAALWLLSSASTGRVGLPRDPRSVAAIAKRIAGEVSRSWERLASRIESEQRLLLNSGLWDRIGGG